MRSLSVHAGRVGWLTAMAGGIVALALGAAPWAQGAELWVGGATTSITPDRPVAVDGQFGTRIARTVEAPLLATAVAIETREGERVLDQAIMVSCDLLSIREGVQDQLRQALGDRLPGVDLKKIFLTATHTHTAPVMEEGKYEIPAEGVMQPREYVPFLIGRLSDVIVEAWKKRQPGGVSWGLGHAVVGHNRRSVYANGTAQMYGDTSRPDFRQVESGEDHTLELLFFWDKEKKPLAVAVNVGCTSQEVEGRSTVNADFWHDVRKQLQTRLGQEILVLGWPGAAGDQSPHPIVRKEAELRMLTLRKLSGTEELARRLVGEVADVLEVTRQDIRTDVPLIHKVEQLTLPRRQMTPKDVAFAQAEIDRINQKPKLEGGDFFARQWHQDVIDRAQQPDKLPPFTMELHALRIGDVAIVTNPFELFWDYGLQMKARSKAQQTFVLQLTCNSSGYLPTRVAVEGGGYSAVAESGLIGPEGGQALVERSIELINSLW